MVDIKTATELHTVPNLLNSMSSSGAESGE